MAVEFDSFTVVHGIGVTSLTTPAFTIAGANRVGLLGLSLDVWEALSGFSGSLGGVSASPITGADTEDLMFIRALQWGVIAPPTGSRTATMSWTGANNAVLGVVTFTGADQTAPFVNGAAATGTSATASVTIASAVGDMTMDTATGYNDGLDHGALFAPTQTQRWDRLIGADTISGAGSTAAGAASNVHQWSISDAFPRWASVGCSVKAAAAAAAELPIVTQAHQRA